MSEQGNPIIQDPDKLWVGMRVRVHPPEHEDDFEPGQHGNMQGKITTISAQTIFTHSSGTVYDNRIIRIEFENGFSNGFPMGWWRMEPLRLRCPKCEEESLFENEKDYICFKCRFGK